MFAGRWFLSVLVLSALALSAVALLTGCAHNKATARAPVTGPGGEEATALSAESVTLCDALHESLTTVGTQDCDRVCHLSARVCVVADRICVLADDNASLDETCADARLRCIRAQRAVSATCLCAS